MDDVNRFAREVADAIAAAVAESPQVEACRERARAAGFEMKITLEAVVGFANRKQQAQALARVAAPSRMVPVRRGFEVTANDRRFLRSLRIAADETAEPVILSLEPAEPPRALLGRRASTEYAPIPSEICASSAESAQK